MNRPSIRFFVLPAFALISFTLLGAGLPAAAQTSGQPPTPSAPEVAPAQTFTVNQLDDLVAPVALFPDPLLTQVLVASTYPLELVEAQQWLQQNHRLSGTQLMDAARQQDWDPSVQALVAFPDVLNRLNSDIRWTLDLGNAFLAQQADVMRAVQHMRALAKANGRLTSTAQQTVTTETQGNQSVIVIQPANPNVMYVPIYNPAYIWGPPVGGYYPTLIYPVYGFGFWPGINIGLSFGGWSGWGWGWSGWGWGPSWFGSSVFVNPIFFNHFGFHDHDFHGHGHNFHGGSSGWIAWAHNPSHRLGVSYPNRQLAGRYQAPSAASRANTARFAGRNSFNQPNGSNRNALQAARPGSQQFANRAGPTGNLGQAPRSASPHGGAARSFTAPQSRSFTQPLPNAGHSFGGGHGGGFGGGHGGGHR